jgi:hypothetical protein
MQRNDRSKSQVPANLLSSLRSGLAGLTVFAVLLLPRVSQACSVCSAGNEDENRLAFILTTAFLTFMPLTMVGALVLWLKQRVLSLEVAHEEARALETPAR